MSGYPFKRLHSRDAYIYLSLNDHKGIIHKSQKLESKNTDEWINKMCYIQTMKYYAALKMKGILTCATVLMNLEVIIITEAIPAQKDII
jgi:hypothetical protein